RQATLAMARLPNTPRPPKLAARIPGPASVRAEAVVKRPPVPANRAVATRGDANERPAKLRPAKARPPICDPPKRATPKERAPTPGPAEPRHAEGATPPDPAAARAKAHPPAPPKPAMAAKAATVPAEASSACVGFKREKRNGEEQYRDSANAGHRPPAPGA